MNFKRTILIACLGLSSFLGKAQQTRSVLSFDFLGNTITIPSNPFSDIKYTSSLTDNSINEFYQKLNITDYQPVVSSIVSYRDEQNLDDWLFYQLVRKTAEQISPKAENYFSYTIYKWFLLTKSGYDAI